jgi:hypothetical protein
MELSFFSIAISLLVLSILVASQVLVAYIIYLNSQKDDFWLQDEDDDDSEQMAS